MTDKDRLEQELGDCIAQNSYICSIAACAIAVPASIRLKSYTPLVFAIVGGTLSDMAYGELRKKCSSNHYSAREIFSFLFLFIES